MISEQDNLKFMIFFVIAGLIFGMCMVYIVVNRSQKPLPCVSSAADIKKEDVVRWMNENGIE